MGGKNSKPVVESARSVINRRNAKIDTSDVTRAVSQVNSGAEAVKEGPAMQTHIPSVKASVPTSKAPQQDGNELNINIVSEISKWNLIKDSDKAGNKPVSKHKGQSSASIHANSATLIRLNEESKYSERDFDSVSIPGRLNEKQLLDMLIKMRDNKDYTDEMAAADNELPVKNVRLMRESVRAALVKKDTKGDGYSFAV